MDSIENPVAEAYRRIYQQFQSSISRHDCGKHCSPHNGGEPVCCSTKDAVPLVDKWEWELLKGRTQMWRPYVPNDASGRKIVEDLHEDCRAIECKGARHCERDNRTMACRTFPFFPYIDRAGRFIGLAYLWDFEDRCWVISNLQIVDKGFVAEFIDAYELLFTHDKEELAANRDHSATMRRVFSRWKRVIPLIGRDGTPMAIEPVTHVVRPASYAEFPKHGPYRVDAMAAAD
jgi:hypothetical protein